MTPIHHENGIEGDSAAEMRDHEFSGSLSGGRVIE